MMFAIQDQLKAVQHTLHAITFLSSGGLEVGLDIDPSLEVRGIGNVEVVAVHR